MSAKQQLVDAVSALPDSTTLEEAFQRLYAAFREKMRQQGRPPAMVMVMVTAEEHKRAAREREILLLLARGEREIAAGVGEDLDAVLRDADAMLAAPAAQVR